MTRTIALLAALLAALPVRAEEVEICFNYGCSAKATVQLSAADLARVGSLFADAGDAAAERRAVADAVAVLYAAAGSQTPVWRDRGGNLDDDEADGRMDCIDHSTNTTAWLRLIEAQGWLRHHAVGERVKRRRLIFEHWSARIVESGTGAAYAVDTWFLDPGHPATIFPLEEWLGGAYPEAAAAAFPVLGWN